MRNRGRAPAPGPLRSIARKASLSTPLSCTARHLLTGARTLCRCATSPCTAGSYPSSRGDFKRLNWPLNRVGFYPTNIIGCGQSPPATPLSTLLSSNSKRIRRIAPYSQTAEKVAKTARLNYNKAFEWIWIFLLNKSVVMPKPYRNY